MLLNGTQTPRSKVPFKQKMERHQRVLVGKSKRTGWQNRQQSMSLLLGTTFTQKLLHSRGIYEENACIKFNNGRLAKCSSSQCFNKKRHQLNIDVNTLFNAKPCSCTKPNMPWPLYKINTTPTNLKSVHLINMFQQHLHAFIYPGVLSS